MTAEIIEKGDATFTVKYSADCGQEALIIYMMGTAVDYCSYLMASHEAVTVPSLRVLILKSLSDKFGPSVAR